MNRGLVIGCLLCATTVSVAIVAFARLHGSRSSTQANAVRLEDQFDQAIFEEVDAIDSPPAWTAEVANAVKQAGGKDELGRDVAAILIALTAEDGSLFLDTLREQGVTPYQGWTKNPSWFAEGWRERRPPLVTASFDLSKTVVRDPSGPHATSPQTRQKTSRRDDGRPFLDHIPPSQRLTREVVFSGTLTGQNGESFEGRLGIEMTWNPETKRWAYTAVSLYDIPGGVLILTPLI